MIPAQVWFALSTSLRPVDFTDIVSLQEGMNGGAVVENVIMY